MSKDATPDVIVNGRQTTDSGTADDGRRAPREATLLALLTSPLEMFNFPLELRELQRALCGWFSALATNGEASASSIEIRA